MLPTAQLFHRLRSWTKDRTLMLKILWSLIEMLLRRKRLKGTVSDLILSRRIDRGLLLRARLSPVQGKCLHESRTLISQPRPSIVRGSWWIQLLCQRWTKHFTSKMIARCLSRPENFIRHLKDNPYTRRTWILTVTAQAKASNTSTFKHLRSQMQCLESSPRVRRRSMLN